MTSEPAGLFGAPPAEPAPRKAKAPAVAVTGTTPRDTARGVRWDATVADPDGSNPRTWTVGAATPEHAAEVAERMAAAGVRR